MSLTFQVISPVDGSICAEEALANQTGVEAVLERAEQAQQHWASKPLSERQQLLHKAIDLFTTQADAITRELVWQVGRPIAFAGREVSGVEERARFMIDIASKVLKPYYPPEKPGFTRYIAREPVGVALVVAPWNYPYLTAINAIIPALAAGNTVILKHSSQTPLCAKRLFDVFTEAGLPEGVFQYLHLTHQDTESVMADSRIGYVHFTGSVQAGHKVQQVISHRFISAGLELGGKDPAYVRADACIYDTAEQLADGSFFNSGQSCCGIERIYVHQSLYDEFLAAFVDLTREYLLDNPFHKHTSLGPMIKTAAADFARKQVQEAIAAGARGLLEESQFPKSQPGTPYLAPQVLANVNHSMRVMTEESFAPVVGIMPVRSDKEAVHWMNDCNLGLTASVWTEDQQAAIAIGEQLEAGTVFMNRCDNLDPALVWTGVKNTGRGYSLSKFGYEPVTRLKSYHLKNSLK